MNLSVEMASTGRSPACSGPTVGLRLARHTSPREGWAIYSGSRPSVSVSSQVDSSCCHERCALSSVESSVGTVGSLEHEVYLALRRLVVGFYHDIAELLKAHGVSAPQFNILRVLHGALLDGVGGLAAGEIGARLITHAPDLTHLLDRMAAQELIVRARKAGDRRVVTAHITDKGLALLAELHKRHLGHLGPERLRALKELLEAARRQPLIPRPVEERYED